MVDSVLLLSIVTISSGVVGLCIRYVFKCKCNEVDFCCGLITVHRDINAEKEIAVAELDHGVASEDGELAELQENTEASANV